MQPEQLVRFPDIDAPVRLDLRLVFLGAHQSAVRNLYIVNSIPPRGDDASRSIRQDGNECHVVAPDYPGYVLYAMDYGAP
jgi:hypothetical protein